MLVLQSTCLLLLGCSFGGWIGGMKGKLDSRVFGFSTVWILLLLRRVDNQLPPFVGYSPARECIFAVICIISS